MKRLLVFLMIPILLFADVPVATTEPSLLHPLFLLFIGLAFGIILMVVIYNLVLYYYHGEKYFLYYALMQSGIIGVLLYDTRIIAFAAPTQHTDSLFYMAISLFTLFFIVMFTRAFLETATLLPKHDRVLKWILIVIAADALFYPFSLLFDTGLYLFIFPYIAYLGYKRVHQHYKPARFFFIGWSFLYVTLLIDAFVDFEIDLKPYDFNPMFIGVVVEAILLAIAVIFQFRLVREENEKQKQLLIHQSKLASMGEMLGNIAHQWRQPLARLSFTLMNIESTQDEKSQKPLFKEAEKQLEFMSQTIDDFTYFYAPDKDKEQFSLKEAAQEIVELLYDKGIEILIRCQKESDIYTYKNEFKQVLLNLISNAKEMLILRKTVSPKIMIDIDGNTVSVEDNAGGIQLEDIEKVFEPYFSTKEKGLGIGLYMSKVIIEQNMQGRLLVQNTPEGARFTIVFHASNTPSA